MRPISPSIAALTAIATLAVPVTAQTAASPALQLRLANVVAAQAGTGELPDAEAAAAVHQAVAAQQAAAAARNQQEGRNPAQMKMQILQQMQYDRTTAGILQARLQESRPEPEQNVQAGQPAPGGPPQEQKNPGNQPGNGDSPPVPGAEEGAAPAPGGAPGSQPPPQGNPEQQQRMREARERQQAQAREMEAFRKEAETFRRDVILSRWDKVAEFLARLPKEQAPEVYALLVTKLAAVVAVNPSPELAAQGAQPHTQQPYLPPADVLGLAAAAPAPPEPPHVQLLARLVPRTPRPPEDFFKAFESGIRYFGGKDPADRLRAARLLVEAGFIKDAAAFLPTAEEAKAGKNYAALNLIARQRSEWAQTDSKAAGKGALPLAWDISTSIIADKEAPVDARGEALFRALSLIPAMGDRQGQEWLEKTFGKPDGEGLELLASLGILTAQSQENPLDTLRLEQLKIQHAAVSSVVGKLTGETSAWNSIFSLYARQWAWEAQVTQRKDASNSRRMVQQYDEWGNVFFARPPAQFDGSGARPIPAGRLLEVAPDERWLASVEPSVRNECLLATARLYLKVKEEANALPLVKVLAKTHKEDAIALVREVIRVWGENHNPNSDQNYRSRYMYFYGFNNQSGAIPLTRSKQERNLVELAALVKGVRELDLDETFQNELASAFIACHSQAEVWRIEAIDSVFGATDALDSRTLATLADQMRRNLAGLWPDPKLQQSYQTKRKDKELQEQVQQGYTSAIGVLEKALARKPEEAWRLEMQLAALKFEDSNYRSTLAPDSNHARTKRAALDALAAAAKNYAATLPLEDAAKESTDVFETWFYAALGSPTLPALKAHHVPAQAEYPLIAGVLATLPEEARERHLKSFATTLNSRLANVSPDLKLRYLEAATAVVPGRPEMKDAADVLGYYRDLVQEIQLDASLDGSGRVGASQPFGVRVNLRHTREIERESGGFQRYLQNQTGATYAYNFGRPTEDYRDKFEKAARAVLEEHFEVVSVTFHSDKVESRTDPQFGWRLTPYAYLLLKAKGPEVDRVPPMKIDLDFNDTSGYVVLPVTSGEIPLDASSLEARPVRDVKVVQTVDERSHAEKGSLYLEVKATAHGLVPPLESLMKLPVEGFETGAIEDRGMRVVEADAATDDLAPVSEHEWRIELKPQGGQLPAVFRFPEVSAPLAEQDGLVRQRYSDVDLLPAEAEMALGVKSSRLSPGLVVAVAALLVLVAGSLLALFRKKTVTEAGPVAAPLPVHMNAVSVIGYLRRLQKKEGMPDPVRQSIEEEILSLESRHFGPGTSEYSAAELEQIARKWQAAA